GEEPRGVLVERAAGARVDVVGAERLTEDALYEIALLVGGLAAHHGRRGRARLAQPACRSLERTLPGRRAQEAAVAHERLDHAVSGGAGLIAPAALVAQPTVVHGLVVVSQHALDPLVSDREGDVALARAECADRARVDDVP